MQPKTQKLIERYALQNAVFYGGKANPGAVLGKVLADNPKLRKVVGEVRSEVEKTVKDINKLSPAEQKKRLAKLAPKMLEKEAKPREMLPGLKGAKAGKLVTRFAVAPTGPLHISHLLRAACLGYLYAEKYKGKFLLRFDDTDPKNVEKAYYVMIKEDLKASGIKWSREFSESDRMSDYYKHAERLLKSGKAYVCTCPAERFRKLKLEKKTCPCRPGGAEWKDMLSGKYREGEAVVRLKLSMRDPNPVLRDPPLLRIVRGRHPLKGTKYRVWPLYNYACAIDDHNEGITHVFRAKEHEHNTAVQSRIYAALGWNPPQVINFGMIYLPGSKLHTRDMKQMIEKGKASGWDDPALPTVRAMLRRGFQPQAFREAAVQCGLTKTDIRLSWENMEGTNRKIIDPLANRYMVVLNPAEIRIKGAPPMKNAEAPLHPDFPRRGKKRMPVNHTRIFISREDQKALQGKEFRLKSLFNVRLKGSAATFSGADVKNIQKIQWVSGPHVKVEVVAPQKRLKGVGENAMRKLKPGDLIQMERIGFARVDSTKAGSVTLFFAHK